MKYLGKVLVLFFVAIMTLSAMSAVASATPNSTKENAKGAIGMWTVGTSSGPITIFAGFVDSSLRDSGNGKVTSQDLIVSVTHPFGTSQSEVQTFVYKWSMDHASVTVKAMPFTAFGKVYYHDITIQWKSTSAATVTHFKGFVEPFNVIAIESGKAAEATMTIYSPIASLALIHSGTYVSDQATIVHDIAIVK